jgi:hypothetical protein
MATLSAIAAEDGKTVNATIARLITEEQRRRSGAPVWRPRTYRQPGQHMAALNAALGRL